MQPRYYDLKLANCVPLAMCNILHEPLVIITTIGSYPVIHIIPKTSLLSDVPFYLACFYGGSGYYNLVVEQKVGDFSLVSIANTENKLDLQICSLPKQMKNHETGCLCGCRATEKTKTTNSFPDFQFAEILMVLKSWTQKLKGVERISAESELRDAMQNSHKSLPFVTSNIHRAIEGRLDDRDFMEITELLEEECDKMKEKIDHRAQNMFSLMLFCAKKILESVNCIHYYEDVWQTAINLVIPSYVLSTSWKSREISCTWCWRHEWYCRGIPERNFDKNRLHWLSVCAVTASCSVFLLPPVSLRKITPLRFLLSQRQQ